MSATAVRLEAGGGKDLASRPGRNCPVSYRYSPQVFQREAEIAAETLYVIGGLYGNVEALEAIVAMASAERRPVTLVFNGDFHWFDVQRDDYLAIEQGVRAHCAIRGNVETEIASDDPGAGCGCAYPMDVSDAVVSRSNEILASLRATAIASGSDRAGLGALPMHLVASVGAARIGIVHGDAASLAGWGFAHDRLDDPDHGRWIESAFREACVDVFASTHTCLPAFRHFSHGHGDGLVANNGAAGMPNFAGEPYGLLTRISRQQSPGRLFGVEVQGTHVEALPVRYDTERWMRRFLSAWPAGSPAHDSYLTRIASGPVFALEQSAPRRIPV